MDFAYWQTTCAILIPGVLLASWIDYTQRRVPNWLNALLIVAGFIVRLAISEPRGLPPERGDC